MRIRLKKGLNNIVLVKTDKIKEYRERYYIENAQKIKGKTKQYCVNNKNWKF
jgi:hypothetical protein